MLSQPPFSYLDSLAKIDDAIDVNADLAEAIADAGLQSFETQQANSSTNSSWNSTATKHNLDKARSTLNQFYRDWSAEGRTEHDVIFRAVFADLASFLAPKDHKPCEILVPGAGLGRLVFDLCCQGYTVEGNEVSYHQLLASSFILNHTTRAGQYRVHPWISTFANHLCREDQLRVVAIPDVHPGSTKLDGRMSMTCGDFCAVYSDESCANRFDAVITVFFIDTAPNFFEYVRTVQSCLKEDGLWINIGPLLWHFEAGKTRGEGQRVHSSSDLVSAEDDIARQPGFELTDEEVKHMLRLHDFQLVYEDDSFAESGYIQNPRSLLQNMYRSSHWVARKQKAGTA